MLKTSERSSLFPPAADALNFSPVKVNVPEGVDLDYLKNNRTVREKLVDEHQDRLKAAGDWIIFPLTLRMIAGGSFALSEGKVYLDGVEMPRGLRL